MSNVIPPMVSSSPPPMDDEILDSDEDDEFGDFSTADLSYGVDLSQSSKVSISTSWKETEDHIQSSPRESINFKSDTSQHNGTHLILELQDSNVDVIEENDTSGLSGDLQQDGISQDSIVSVGTDSGLCSVSQDSVETSPVPHEDRITSMSPIISQEDSSESDETMVKSLTIDTDRTLPSIISTTGNVESMVELEERILDHVDNTLSKMSFNNYCSPTIEPVEDLTDCDSDQFSEVKPELESISPVNEFTDFNLDNFTEFQSEIETSPSKYETSNFESDTAISTLSSGLITLTPRGDQSSSCSASSDKEDETFTINSLNESKQLYPNAEFADESRITLCASSVLEIEKLDKLENAADVQWQSAAASNYSESPVLEPCFSDSEFDEFTAFESADLSISRSDIPPIEDDEFSDFSSSAFVSTKDSTSFFPASKCDDSGWANESAMHLPSISTVNDENNDDFDDFETASISVANHDQLSTRLDTMVTTLFPSQSNATTQDVPATPSSQRIIDSSVVWKNLHDVDTSNALSYQWVSSSTNKMLLTSLGIDARNILFGPKWNVSVPRFAANLGISPLEPMRASTPPPLVPTRELPSQPPQLTPVATSSTHSEVVVPDAQFDWTSSGLVNPLDCTQSALLDLNYLNTFDNLTLSTSASNAAWRFASVEKNGQRATTQEHTTFNNGQRLLNTAGGLKELSVDAVKVLDSLPNLSFLRAKSLVFPRHVQTHR